MPGQNSLTLECLGGPLSLPRRLVESFFSVLVDKESRALPNTSRLAENRYDVPVGLYQDQHEEHYQAFELVQDISRLVEIPPCFDGVLFGTRLDYNGTLPVVVD